MAIEGALQDVSLADICQLLAVGRKTGCLSLTDRSNFGYVYFNQGRVIHASVLNRQDRLGELLVRNHMISRSDLSAAMEAQAHERGARLGELLVRNEAISEEDLQKYISLQIEEAVYHLFTWAQGSFHFDPDQRPDEDGLFLVNIPAEMLLLEGARRVDEWSLIEKKIPSLDLIFDIVKSPEDSEEVEITKNQRRVLPFLDGQRSVSQIVSESGLVEFDVGKALYGLIQAGFVEKATAGMAETEEPATEGVQEHLNLGIAFYRSGMLEDAAREYQEAIASEPTNARALFQLGMISFKSRRLQEALEYFDKLPEAVQNGYAVLRNRALALELMRRFDEALEVLDQADAVRPGDHDLALARGIVLVRKGDVGSAMEALRRYRTDPDIDTPSALYYSYTVLAAGLAGQYDYAIAVGREGLGHHSNSGPLLVNTAAVLEEKGEAHAAQALYQRAVKQNPAPAQAHKSLGDQAYDRADMDEARVHYEKAVKLDSRLGDDLYFKLGHLALRDSDDDVARLLWRRALELNPKNAAVQAELEALDASA